MRVRCRAGRVERAAQRADAAVHHVGRRDHVDARRGVAERLLDQRLDRLVVHHVAGRVDQAVLPVARVRIERDVGDHAELGEARLQRAHGARHEVVRAPRLRRVGDFRSGGITGNSAIAGTPSSMQASASCASAVERLARRRRAATAPAPRGRAPSSTNTGRMKSSGVSRVSRIMPAREIVAAHAARALVGKSGGEADASWREGRSRRSSRAS